MPCTKPSTSPSSGLSKPVWAARAAQSEADISEWLQMGPRGEKPPRGVGSEPGDRQDWQRISGKMRRKSMPVLSVPGRSWVAMKSPWQFFMSFRGPKAHPNRRQKAHRPSHFARMHKAERYAAGSALAADGAFTGL